MGEAPEGDSRPSDRVFDAHLHYVPRSALEQLDSLEHLGIRYDKDLDQFLRLGESQQGLGGGLFELQESVPGNGRPVTQILSPWSDLIRDDVPAEEGAAWCRTLNDAVRDDIANNDDYLAFAALPTGSPDHAAAELERAVAAGFVGGMIPTQVGGVNLDEWRIDPLLEASERLGAPIFIHPAKVLAPERLNQHFLRNLCGFPFETTVAAFCLFFSGAFERYPDAKVMLAHAGGLLTFLAGRAAHATYAVNDLGPEGVRAPSILEPFFYDCVVHEPSALAFALSEIGPEKMVLGSDGPFTMGLTDPLSHVAKAATLAGLDGDEIARQVGCETPLRMLPPNLSMAGSGA
jgi:aminocarboxymuconate-semialdehyde decarboxylase